MSKTVSSDSVGGNTQFQAVIPNQAQSIAISASSVQSTALHSNTTIIRLFATQDCFVAFGTNPTATSSMMFMPGGILEYFGVVPGSKVAAIQSSTSGTLYILEAM